MIHLTFLLPVLKLPLNRPFSNQLMLLILLMNVFSNDCISSDANATGILVMGLEKAKLFLAKHQEFEAYLIYSDEQGQYQVYMTPGLKDMIQEVEGE